MNREKRTSNDNLSGMMGLDIYFDALSKNEYQQVSQQMHPKKNVISPLISWEYFMMSYSSTIEHIKHSKDLAAIKSLQLTHQWQEDLTELLTNQFDALVLTNTDSIIEWVSPGFQNMTGYSSNFALGKTPQFLQGEKTSTETLARIRKHIDLNERFKESVINYRKDKSEYRCELTVFPLSTHNGNTTHFLALEKEIR